MAVSEPAAAKFVAPARIGPLTDGDVSVTATLAGRTASSSVRMRRCGSREAYRVHT